MRWFGISLNLCVVVNICKADIGLASFRNADLGGANMRCRRIAEADFEGAKYDETTVFPKDFFFAAQPARATPPLHPDQADPRVK